MGAPSEAATTIAVDAAARKAWDLHREQQRGGGWPEPPTFDDLPPADQLRVRAEVLPLIWAALEALQRNTAGATIAPGPCGARPAIAGPGWWHARPVCELRAGHAGLHECDRGSGGTWTWSDES